MAETTATIFEDDDTYSDGTHYEMVATAVPKSDDYPEGVKYRFQYMAADGRTLLRFDDYPFHPDVGRHHYHTPDGVFDDIEYDGLPSHVRKFHDAIDDRRDR